MFIRLISLLFMAVATACSPSAINPLDIDAGAGSAEPHLASGPNGTIVLSFLEPISEGTALRFAVFSDDAWSHPKTLASGNNWMVNWADFPSVVPLTEKIWAAHWLVHAQGGAFAYDVVVSVSKDAGSSWNDPKKVHTDGTPTEHGFVSLYPSAGGVGALWLDGRAMVSEHSEKDALFGTQLRAAVVRNGLLAEEALVDDFVCDCCQTDVAIARTGPVVAYRNRTQGEIRDIYLARQVGGEWQTGIAVADDGWRIAGCPVNGPAIDAKEDVVVVAWFTAAPSNRVQLAFSSDNAKTFDAPIDIGASDPIGRVDVALLKDGGAFVSWIERGVGKLMARRVYRDGQLDDSLTITNMETHRDAGFPQMVASPSGLIFAWTDTTGDSSRVRSLQVVGQ